MNSNSKYDLSIAIPFYKRDKYVSNILSALDKENEKLQFKVEIIFIDSNSSQILEDTLTNFNFISDLYARVVNTDNNAVAKRNLGIQEAASNNIIFLDDDCVPCEDFIKNHFENLNNSSDKIIYCGIVKFSEELCKVSNYYRFRDSRHRTFDFLYSSNNDIDFNNFITMNMSFKKSDMLKNKLFFDKDYETYGLEDTQFGLDAIKKGFKIKTTNATIIHRESTSIDLFLKKIKNFTRNYFFIFYKKNADYLTNKNSKRTNTYNFISYNLLIKLAQFYAYTDIKFPFILNILSALSVLLNPIIFILKTFLKISDSKSILYSYWAYKVLIIITILSTLFSKKTKIKNFI